MLQSSGGRLEKGDGFPSEAPEAMLVSNDVVVGESVC